MNRNECAAHFGVDGMTVDRWIRRGMPARKSRRSWAINSAEAFRWLVEREREEAAPQGSEAELKLRRMAADTAAAELEYAKASGQVVAIAEFEAGIAGMIGAARAKLLGFGAKLARAVAVETDPAICRDLIDAAVRDVLVELSEFDGAIPNDGSGPGQSASRDAAGSEAVGASA